MPKQKVKEQEKVVQEIPQAKVAARGYRELVLQLISGMDSEEITDKELIELIDGSFLDDVEAKEKAARVKIVKEFLLRLSEKVGVKILDGAKAIAQIKSSTRTEIESKKFIRWLEENGMTKMTNDLLKVQVGQVKKYLGEDIADKVGETTTEEYGSVSLKAKK